MTEETARAITRLQEAINDIAFALGHLDLDEDDEETLRDARDDVEGIWGNLMTADAHEGR